MEACIQYLSFIGCMILSLSCYAKVPKVWNIDTNSTIITGRETEISDIFHMLNTKENDTAILAITGLPGYGKTETVKAYAKTYKNGYDVCWMFDSKRELLSQIIEFSYQWNKSFPNNKISITQNKLQLLKEIKQALKKSDSDILFILDNINPERESIMNFKNALRISPKNWLLIFDGTSNLDAIQELIPTHHTTSKGHVLITSQNSENWPKVYKLDILKNENIFKIFQATEQDQIEIKNIAQTLKHHPFAIYKAYKEIHNQKYNLKDYLDMLKSFKDKNILDPSIKMTKMHIEKFVANNKLGAEFIELLFLMDNNFIPGHLLKLFWIIMGHTENELNSLIFEASTYLILDPGQQTSSGTKFYKYHDIVRSSFEKTVDQSKQLDLAKLLTTSIFSRAEIDDAPYLTENFSHKVPIIENIVAIADKFNEINPNISDLYLNVIEYYALYTRQFHECVRLISAYDNINKFISKVAPREQAIRFHTTLSGLYWWLEDHKLGLSHQIQAEKISVNIKATNTIQFERILNYAASHYLFLGESEKAMEYITKLQMINDGKIDDNKFDTTNLINLNLINYYILVGDYEKCIVLADKIYASIKDKPSQRFLYHITAYLIRYEAYAFNKDNLISLEEIMNTTQKVEEVLGEQHRITAKTKILLGAHMIHQGKTHKAKDLLLKQLVILDGWFGSKIKHKERAMALSLLGDCFYIEMDYNTARKYYEQAYSQLVDGFTNMKNNDVKKVVERLIAVNSELNKSLIVHDLLSTYKKIFGKDKQYDKLIFALATKKRLDLSDL
jgi:tetratricopeptide (TPR) repeat protein